MSDDPTTIAELPPSAKLVYKTLQWEGRQTQKQLAEEAMLSKRTIRFALDRLEEIDVVDEDVYIPDARQNIYTLSGEPTAESDASA